ncbi:hypothetical protein IAT40_003278 [Kwoniella sp. CBS 6097]
MCIVAASTINAQHAPICSCHSSRHMSFNWNQICFAMQTLSRLPVRPGISMSKSLNLGLAELQAQAAKDLAARGW